LFVHLFFSFFCWRYMIEETVRSMRHEFRETFYPGATRVKSFPSPLEAKFLKKMAIFL
jgi:hypothetical protein